MSDPKRPCSRCVVPACVVPVVVIIVSCGAMAAAWSVSPAEPGLRVEAAGPFLPFPATLPLADGGEARVTGVSGITWLGGDRYAAVMDNSRYLLTFAVEVDPSGQPQRITAGTIVPLPEAHDYEDLAAWPPPGPASVDTTGVRRLFLGEEDTPAVRICRWPDVRLEGGLRLPKVFRSIRANRGVEAVAADPDGQHVWAANEEALLPDGPTPTPATGTVIRLARLAIMPMPDRQPAGRAFQAGYAVGPPHPFVRLFEHQVYAGVVALVALGDGKLLVLERSGCPGLPPFSNRIEWIDTADAADVSGLDGALAMHPDRLVAKRTLWSGSVAANLEGLCLGPPSGPGRLLLGVTDDGGMALPSALVGFRLLPAEDVPSGKVQAGQALDPVPAPVTSP